MNCTHVFFFQNSCFCGFHGATCEEGVSHDVLWPESVASGGSDCRLWLAGYVARVARCAEGRLAVVCLGRS